MKKLIVTICASSLALPGMAAQPAREGLWEYTTRMEMPGLPSQPMSQRICLSAKDMEEGPMPKDDKCKLKDYQLTGNTASWQMECQGDNKMSGEGKITFTSDISYAGETRMRIQAKGQPPIEMSQKFNARRLGDCKK